MNRPLVSKPWRPPYDYKIGAAALPLELRAAYIAKCKEWFDNNPEPAPVPVALKPKKGPNGKQHLPRV